LLGTRLKACEQGVRTLFVSPTALITTLGKALVEGKLDEGLKLLTQPQLLICERARSAICRSIARAPICSSSWSRAATTRSDHHHYQSEFSAPGERSSAAAFSRDAVSIMPETPLRLLNRSVASAVAGCPSICRGED
jgi:hypothetical protein